MLGCVQGIRSGTGAAVASERDRFIDLVRVTCLAAVVFLHWLSVVPDVRDGKVVDRNVVDLVPGLWPLTWTGDVMALFFFVGGYANWVSLQAGLGRGESRSVYLARRLRRLIRPTVGFLGLWLGVDLLLRAAGAGALSPLRHVAIGNTIPFGPLWFVGVYVVVIAISPWTVRAHHRWGILVPVGMVICVASADVVAFVRDSGWPLAINLVLVWLIPHQLGYFYADGRFRRLSMAACSGMAAAGLAALVLLTSLPYYPRSLVTPRWTVLGFDAPMLSQVAGGLWLVGLAMLLRRPAERLLAEPGRWRLVGLANDSAMPVYLWHMTAYLIVAVGLARLGAGFVYATRPSLGWWLGRPVMVVLAAVVLAGIVSALRRTSRLSRRAPRWRAIVNH